MDDLSPNWMRALASAAVVLTILSAASSLVWLFAVAVTLYQNPPVEPHDLEVLHRTEGAEDVYRLRHATVADLIEAREAVGDDAANLVDTDKD